MTFSSLTPDRVHSELKKSILADGFEIVLDIEKSKGSYLVDAKTGRKYLDLFTFFASSPVGMNHPKLTSPAAKEIFARIGATKPSCSDLYSVEMAEFVKTFREKAMPPGFKYAFFIEGGALAVENALKVAFDYKVQRNFAKGATREIGTQIIHFRGAFHGRSGYTLSLTNTLPDKINYFPKFQWPRFDTPGIKFPIDAKGTAELEAMEKKVLDQIRWTGQHQGDDVAAIIIETIQGEGGDVHFRKEFLQGLRKLCDEFDWLLIFDEIQSGFGITGKFWAFQHFGVEPDIATFGKKSQVCGIVVRDTIDRVPTNVFHVSSRINSTWGGNLIDMVRCKMYLDIIEEEKLVENAARQGERLLTGLAKLEQEFPNIIYGSRGRGLMCAFSFRDIAKRAQFLKEMYDGGALILPCGANSVRFRPPLNLSNAELDEAMSLIKKSLSKIG